MLQYYIIVKGSIPYCFYDSDDTMLFEISRKYKFPKYLFTIKNSQEDLFIFETKNILFKQTKILFQNFKDKIGLVKNNKLTVRGKIISIVEHSKIFGKYKSLIIVDNKTIGEINEENYSLFKKYKVTFNQDNEINYYCLILFTIISVHFSDGI